MIIIYLDSSWLVICEVSRGYCVYIVEIGALAAQVGAKVLVDACQSVPNMPVDVGAIGADWLVASSHKMCGPTGIGFLWGRCSPPFLPVPSSVRCRSGECRHVRGIPAESIPRVVREGRIA